MKLWLDDIRPPLDGSWTWAHNYDEAVELLKTGEVEYASLDHDLGDGNRYRLSRDENDDSHLWMEEIFWNLGDPCPKCGSEESPKFNGGNPLFQCCNITVDEYAWSLSRKEKTGYDVTLWMAENNTWPRDGILVHSWNPVGAERMQGVVDRYGPYDTVCRAIPDPRMWTELHGFDNRQDRSFEGQAT